eukprot:2810601-Rhodomonas_salina.1
MMLQIVPGQLVWPVYMVETPLCILYRPVCWVHCDPLWDSSSSLLLLEDRHCKNLSPGEPEGQKVYIHPKCHDVSEYN